MTTGDLSKGIAIKYNNETYVVTGLEFVNPGKGAAFTRTKLKNVKTGKTMEVTIKSGETIEEADMQYKKCQYLYRDADNFYFMDGVTYDQFSIGAEMVGDLQDFMTDNMDITVVTVDGNPVSLQLPKKMVFNVVEAPPGEKGDTATGGSKAVKIETGAMIQAPLFIKEGDKIRVNTETHEYVERATQ